MYYIHSLVFNRYIMFCYPVFLGHSSIYPGLLSKSEIASMSNILERFGAKKHGRNFVRKYAQSSANKRNRAPIQKRSLANRAQGAFFQNTDHVNFQSLWKCWKRANLKTSKNNVAIEDPCYIDYLFIIIIVITTVSKKSVNSEHGL